MAQATDDLISDVGFAWFSYHRVMLGVSQAMLPACDTWLIHELDQPVLHSFKYDHDRSSALKVGSFKARHFCQAPATPIVHQ
jgi:hypothetical protein